MVRLSMRAPPLLDKLRSPLLLLYRSTCQKEAWRRFTYETTEGRTMASYRGHLAFSTVLGAAYGAGAIWQFQIPWAPAALGGGLTALGGLLPDLDSDSGVPVRELFGLAAA